MRVSIRERLRVFYERLAEKGACADATQALAQIAQILDGVEDEFSGITKKSPAPPPEMSDGRMYPPQEDHVRREPDGSIIAITRRHRIEIGRDGSIVIRSRKTGLVEFASGARGGAT